MPPVADASQHPLQPPAAIPLEAQDVRDWICAFADQTQEHAILLLDLQLRVAWANAGAALILGAEREQLVGGPVHRFFTASDRESGIPEHEFAVARSQGESPDDRWMQRLDGSRFWATGRTIALSDARGRLVGSAKIFRSQTDLWMLIRGLQNRVASLEAAEQKRVAALATLAHEIRNPLSVVATYAHLIERQPGGDNAEYVRGMRQRIDVISRLVEDVDHAARNATGQLSLRTERLHLHQVIDEAVETAMARAGAPPRKVHVLLPPGRPIAIRGDAVRLQQALVNLVGNAIKFTGDGGHIWIQGSTEASDIVIRIRDDGVGIDPSLLHSIFEMFVQAPAATSYEPGMGIGLALVKNIVELHGGSIQADSHGPGKGAEFILRLPLSAVAPEAAGERADSGG